MTLVSGWWYFAPRPCPACGQRVHAHLMTAQEIAKYEAETGSTISSPETTK
jgi:hypothetical protein